MFVYLNFLWNLINLPFNEFNIMLGSKFILEIIGPSLLEQINIPVGEVLFSTTSPALKLINSSKYVLY